MVVLHQIKYGLLPGLLLVSLACAVFGGWWLIAIPAIIVSFATWIDEALGDMDANPTLNPVLMNIWLVVCLPFVLLISLVLAAHVSPAPWIDGALGSLGIDFAANRAASSWWQIGLAILGGGLIFGAAAVNVAHELIHRSNAWLYVTGRWLLAFTFDTTFAIEHVHGHHRYVGTERDPATARRGEYVLSFVVRSTIGQFFSAFQLEAARLSRRKLPLLSHHNKAIRGQLMSVALLALHYAVAGWPGVLVLVALGVQGKFYLEVVNYVEHYGLIRMEGTRVEPRHSWNCDRLVSNTLLFNLPRHSHHHQFAAKPFWELHSLDGAPMMPHGYKVMMLLSLFPSVWNAKVDPLLERWETDLATPDEKHAMQVRKAELGLPSAAAAA